MTLGVGRKPVLALRGAVPSFELMSVLNGTCTDRAADVRQTLA